MPSGKCAALLKVQYSGGLQQAVSIEPGAAYKFSAWMKLVKGDVALSKSRIMLSDERSEKNHPPVSSDFLASLKPDVWDLVEGMAQGSGAKQTLIIFVKPSVPVELLVDDVQLLKLTSAPPK